MSDSKKYQILKLVAKGGTAVLYSAVQTSLDRVVAIKKLHSHLTEDENFTRRFVLEAKAAASLDHDNIVKIIDFGIEDGTYHMVMEYIEGESLREVLDKWKSLPIEIALAIVYRVCYGLEHAHSKGIVHRDIKPGNIMITRTGRVKITDFGLAKLTQQPTQHTAANSILGTPLYMSPEQAFGESVDQRSDLFSLGTTLYEMITGVQPFRDEHYMGVIQNIIKRNAPHPSKFSIDLDPPVQAILSKAMNKSREARFQSATDFRKTIEKYLGLAQLKEADESLRQLLNTDGATLILPQTIVGRKRKSRLRRGFIVALAATTLFGAAGIGYTFAPQTFETQFQNIVSWFDQKNIFPRDGMNQMSGMTDQPMSAFEAALFPDTAHVAARGDSSTAVKDTTNVVQVPPAVVPDTTATTPDPIATQTTQQPVAVEEKDEPKPEKPKPVRKGWLSISADPWAEVYVDGVYQGDTPPALRLELTRGPHDVECRNPGYVNYRETVRITSGELSTRRVLLKQLRGWLSIATQAGAEIHVDGKLIGVTPLGKKVEIEAGAHTVTVKKAGFNVWSNEITIIADREFPLSITLSPMY